MQMSADIILVQFFAVLLTLTIVLVYLGPLSGQHWAQTMQWLQVILRMETVLLGSTVGFYFAKRR
jgi:fructose-specific phosphotransferase system IIC component